MSTTRPSRPHRCDGTATLLLSRPAFTQAHSQNCSTKKQMSARADFAGARYVYANSRFARKNFKIRKCYSERGWCPMTKNEVKRPVLAWHISESMMLAADPARDSHQW